MGLPSAGLRRRDYDRRPVGKRRHLRHAAGCARQARDRFPGLAWTLGQQVFTHGNHVFDLGRRIVSFPVEHSPFEVPDLRLIKQSCHELVELTNYKGWEQVVVPRPGCGGGGLDWNEVHPVLAEILDERFLIISMDR